MKIKTIEITSFGKLKNYQLHLVDGFQVLLGNNEDGKTTIMSFLKMMFYKSANRSRALSVNLRKRYAPWDGSPMQGAVEFESGGVSYRLQKMIGDIPSKDKVDLINLINGKPIVLGRDEDVGQRFFSLDLHGFERSCFIGQTGGFDSSNSESLTNRLLENLIQSGDESVSQTDALDRLHKAAEKLVSKNKKKGLLVEAKNKLSLLNDEHTQVLYQLKQQQQDRMRFDELNSRYQASKGQDRQLRLTQLTELLDLEQKIVLSKRDLERPEVPIERIPALLTQLDELANEYTQSCAALDKVQGVDGVSTTSESAWISAEEWAYVEHLDKSTTQTSKELKLLTESIRPAAGEYQKRYERCCQLEDNKQRVRTLLDTQYPGWDQRGYDGTEKQIHTSKLEELREERETQRADWQRQAQLASDRTSLAQQQLAILEAMWQVKNRPLLLIIAGILTVAIVAIALLSKELLVLMGLAIPIILATVHLLRKKSDNIDEMQRERAISNHSDAMQAEKNLKKKIELQEQAYEQKIQELKSRIASLDGSGENSTLPLQLMEEHDQLKSEVQAAQLSANAALDIYRRWRQEFPNSSLPDFPDGKAIREAELHLRGKLTEQSAELLQLLTQKNCRTVDEYQTAFLSAQSNAKNHDLVSSLQETEQNAASALCNGVSSYEPVSESANAMRIFHDLKQKHQTFLAMQAEYTALATGMGLAGQTTQTLVKEQEQLASLLQDAPIDEQSETMSLSVEELDAIEKQLQELSVKIRMPKRPIEQIELEQQALQEHIQGMSQYYRALLMAKEVMEASVEELHSNFGPELREKTGNLLRAMTGVYSNVLISNQYDVQVQTEGHFREYDYFSSGTIDQVYLALRIAISQLITLPKDRLPLFLDDVLMQYDNKRLVQCLHTLKDLGCLDTQILLFTCHDHIIEKAKTMGVTTKNFIQKA